MNATGYLQAVAAFQVIGGLILIVGRFVPLGLTLLGPIVVNILFFHIFLDRTGMPMALVVSAIFLFLVWRYRNSSFLSCRTPNQQRIRSSDEHFRFSEGRTFTESTSCDRTRRRAKFLCRASLSVRITCGSMSRLAPVGPRARPIPTIISWLVSAPAPR